MKLKIIVAMAENRVIGRENALPWDLPKDLDYVRKTTKGKPLIMGSKNHESIGRPLPGRRNIVMTRDKAKKYTGCEMATCVEDVFELVRNEEEVFVFGGEGIYRMFLPFVEEIHLTKIHHVIKGDTFFPELEEREWIEISMNEGVTDEENPYEYSFHILKRVKNKKEML